MQAVLKRGCSICAEKALLDVANQKTINAVTPLGSRAIEKTILHVADRCAFSHGLGGEQSFADAWANGKVVPKAGLTAAASAIAPLHSRGDPDEHS